MRPWTLLIAGAAGLALGLVADELTGPREPLAAEGPGTRQPALDLDLDPLVRAFEESTATLAAELRLLRDALDRVPPQDAAPQRVPVAADGTTVDLSPLVRSMDRLDHDLRLMASEQPNTDSGTVFLPANLRLPAPGARAVPLPNQEKLGDVNIGKLHFLWTCQEILDAYGLPDNAWVNEARELVWSYEEDDVYGEFVFVNGQVIRAEY